MADSSIPSGSQPRPASQGSAETSAHPATENQALYQDSLTSLQQLKSQTDLAVPVGMLQEQMALVQAAILSAESGGELSKESLGQKLLEVEDLLGELDDKLTPDQKELLQGARGWFESATAFYALRFPQESSAKSQATSSDSFQQMGAIEPLPGFDLNRSAQLFASFVPKYIPRDPSSPEFWKELGRSIDENRRPNFAPIPKAQVEFENVRLPGEMIPDNESLASIQEQMMRLSDGNNPVVLVDPNTGIFHILLDPQPDLEAIGDREFARRMIVGRVNYPKGDQSTELSRALSSRQPFAFIIPRSNFANLPVNRVGTITQAMRNRAGSLLTEIIMEPGIRFEVWFTWPNIEGHESAHMWNAIGEGATMVGGVAAAFAGGGATRKNNQQIRNQPDATISTHQPWRRPVQGGGSFRAEKPASTNRHPKEGSSPDRRHPSPSPGARQPVRRGLGKRTSLEIRDSVYAQASKGNSRRNYQDRYPELPKPGLVRTNSPIRLGQSVRINPVDTTPSGGIRNQGPSVKPPATSPQKPSVTIPEPPRIDGTTGMIAPGVPQAKPQSPPGQRGRKEVSPPPPTDLAPSRSIRVADFSADQPVSEGSGTDSEKLSQLRLEQEAAKKAEQEKRMLALALAEENANRANRGERALSMEEYQEMLGINSPTDSKPTTSVSQGPVASAASGAAPAQASDGAASTGTRSDKAKEDSRVEEEAYRLVAQNENITGLRNLPPAKQKLLIDEAKRRLAANPRLAQRMSLGPDFNPSDMTIVQAGVILKATLAALGQWISSHRTNESLTDNLRNMDRAMNESSPAAAATHPPTAAEPEIVGQSSITGMSYYGEVVTPPSEAVSQWMKELAAHPDSKARILAAMGVAKNDPRADQKLETRIRQMLVQAAALQRKAPGREVFGYNLPVPTNHQGLTTTSAEDKNKLLTYFLTPEKLETANSKAHSRARLTPREVAANRARDFADLMIAGHKMLDQLEQAEKNKTPLNQAKLEKAIDDFALTLTRVLSPEAAARPETPSSDTAFGEALKVFVSWLVSSRLPDNIPQAPQLLEHRNLLDKSYSQALQNQAGQSNPMTRGAPAGQAAQASQSPATESTATLICNEDGTYGSGQERYIPLVSDGININVLVDPPPGSGQSAMVTSVNRRDNTVTLMIRTSAGAKSITFKVPDGTLYRFESKKDWKYLPQVSGGIGKVF